MEDWLELMKEEETETDNLQRDDHVEISTSEHEEDHHGDIVNQPKEDQQAEKYLFNDQIKTNWHKTVESFDHMNLREDLLRGIYGHGWDKPSDIQKTAIMPTIRKRDIMVQSQSKMGKIGVYTIASLQRVDLSNPLCQILIISPNKELATSIYEVIQSLGSYMDGLTSHLCIGGASVRKDISELAKGKHIVVGTIGRINDMISRGALRLKSLQLFVMDEANIMLSDKFKVKVCDTFCYLPGKVQVGLFFKTIPWDTLQLCKKFMGDPVKILEKQWHDIYDRPRIRPKKKMISS